MRAMVMHEFGGEDVLQLEHVQKPRISEAEILVEVKSVGVNPIDYIVRSVSVSARYFRVGYCGGGIGEPFR